MIIIFTIFVLVSGGTFLVLQRSMVRAVFGLGLISHAVNLILLVSGVPAWRGEPITSEADLARAADPLPQAFVLTAIVITLAVTILMLALAYQMVAGVGQILIGLVVFTQLSLTAGLFYMVHHMITMGGLILLSGALEHVYGTGRLDRLSGLLRRDRAVAAFMALGFLSLVGLPPTSGLWGKATLLGGAAQAGGATAWLLLGTVVAASIASLMALQHVWRNVFQGRPLELDVDDDVTTTWGDLWPGATLISISVALFVLAGVAWPFFDEAATRLIDLAPYLQAVMGS